LKEFKCCSFQDIKLDKIPNLLVFKEGEYYNFEGVFSQGSMEKQLWAFQWLQTTLNFFGHIQVLYVEFSKLHSKTSY
jgi:hypothetical protein